MHCAHDHTTTTMLWPFFRDHPGEPVPEENFWSLWCKGRLTEADTPTIRLGATPSGLTSAHLHHPPFFTGRMPFLLPNQQCQSTEGTELTLRCHKIKICSILFSSISSGTSLCICMFPNFVEMYHCGHVRRSLLHNILIMAAHSNGQAIIFLSYGFFFYLLFLLSFLLAWSQPSQIGCPPYSYTWCGPSANLECRSEMCCVQLAGNTRRKNRHLGTIAQLCWAISL